MTGERYIEDHIPLLAETWSAKPDDLAGYLTDLRADKWFLSAINEAIADVPEFSGRQFRDVAELRTYRILLYLAARHRKPEVFIETGVQNGMSSAFILLGLLHNEYGKLISIDLPPVDERILAQGTNPLPGGKGPGWIVPDYLRSRHTLCLGRAESLLPQVLDQEGSIDIFLHDSDHSYSHIMFEISLAWAYLKPGGLIMVDNIEQNSAFADFVRGVEATRHAVVSTFDSQERTWQHGLLAKGAS